MEGKYQRKIWKSRLKNRILALFIGVCILLGMIFIAASRVYTGIAEQKVIAHTNNNLSQASNYIALLVDQARETAQYICQKTAVAEFANVKNPAVFETFAALEEIRKDIILLAELNTNIDSIYVYFENADIMATSLYGNYLKETLTDSSVYEAIWGSKAFIGSFRYIPDDLISQKGVISFFVKGSTYNADIHSDVYLFINFDEESIFSIVKDIKSTNPSMAFLLSSDGGILSCDDKNLLGSRFPMKGNEISGKAGGYRRMTIWGQEVYAFVNNRYANLFALVYLTPKEDLLMEKEVITAFMAGVILLFLFAGTLIHIIYMKGVYRPLMKLVDFMEKAEEGNLGNKMEDRREDEFGYLYKTFNAMMTRIDALIQTTHQQDELRRKMELKELEKQINPHFLYNTLDTVNWIAKRNHVPEISRIVISLSTIYKNVFNKGNSVVFCRDAVESCRSYLEIQNIRFHGKLTYVIETNPDLDDCLILNLLLQTLVENAVVHGFENMNIEGAILIRNEYLAEEDAILFTVKDNGVGMTQKKLDLQRKLLERENIVSNSGLTNAQRRIKLYYGRQYGIRMESRLREGTTACMKIPRVTEEIRGSNNMEEKEKSEEG